MQQGWYSGGLEELAPSLRMPHLSWWGKFQYFIGEGEDQTAGAPCWTNFGLYWTLLDLIGPYWTNFGPILDFIGQEKTKQGELTSREMQ